MREGLERIYEQEGLQKTLTSDDFRGFERLFEWLSENGQLFGYILLALGLAALLILLLVLLDSRSSALRLSAPPIEKSSICRMRISQFA